MQMKPIWSYFPRIVELVQYWALNFGSDLTPVHEFALLQFMEREVSKASAENLRKTLTQVRRDRANGPITQYNVK